MYPSSPPKKKQEDVKNASQAGSSFKPRHQRSRTNISARTYVNPNLHPKTDRSHKSSQMHMDISLECLNKTNIKDYEIQCLIGQGSFGVVQRATYKASG